MKNKIASIVLVMALIFCMIPFSCFADATNTEIVPIDKPMPRVTGVSLVLGGDIGLVYHVYIPKDYEEGYVELTCKGNTEKINVADCKEKDDDKRYMLTYHLSAIELSEDVGIAVYDKDGNVLLSSAPYTAEKYVKELLEDKQATDGEKSIAKALINYGHFAQLACAEANGWVIGEDYKETAAIDEIKAQASVFDEEKYDLKWENRSADIKKLYMALNLEYNTEIYLYIKIKNEPNVKINGAAVKPQASTQISGTYEVVIPNINALNLEKEYKIEINGATVTLCPFSYCKTAVEQAPKTTADAMLALYDFYYATANYKE